MNNPLLFGTDDYYEGNFRAFDASGTEDAQAIDLDGLNWNGETNTPLRGVVTPDGRTAYYGNRNQPAVVTLDLLTLTASIGDTVLDGGAPITHDETGDLGYVRAVALSPDGLSLYGSLVTGAHTYEGAISKTAGGTGTLEVVKIDTATMAVVGRLVLVTAVDEASLKEVSLSRDGSRGVIAPLVYNKDYGSPVAGVHGKIYVFDTVTMTLIPGPAADAHDVSGVGVRVGGTAFSPNGTTVYFGAQDGDPDPALFELHALDVATGAITTVASSPANNNDTTELTFGPDGRLYWAQDATLNIFDPAAATWTTPAAISDDVAAWSVEFNRRNYFVVDHDDERATRYRYNDDAVVPAPANPTDADGLILMHNVDESHTELVTPF